MLDHNTVHGIARYAHNLIFWGLRHRPQHEIVVATRNPARWAAVQEEFPQLTTAQIHSAPFNWREHLEWPPLLRDIDLAHFTSISSPTYCQCPYLVTVHDLIPWHFPSSSLHRPYLATVGRWCLSHASGIICVSKYSRKDLLETAPNIHIERVSVISNGGIDGEQMAQTISGEPHPAFSIPQRPYFLCVTNPRPHKNLGVVLQAYESLHQRCDLVLVCSDTNLIQQAQKRFPGIHRLSGLPDTELVELYRSATAVIVPSLYEGFGIPALEAMQMDAPVISSSATSLPEVVGEAGLYFDPHNPTELAQCCLRLLDSPEQCQDLQERGRQRARLFSWDSSAQQHWKLYQEISESPFR